MGFVTNLFRKASEIAFLERENALLEGERDRLKFERDALAKQVVTERSKRDRDNQRFNQSLLQLAGGKHQLLQEPLPLEEPKPLELTQQQRDSIRYLAQEMLDNDVANGEMPLPLEQYERLIESKPAEYLQIMPE